jgi:hypothetical protein
MDSPECNAISRIGRAMFRKGGGLDRMEDGRVGSGRTVERRIGGDGTRKVDKAKQQGASKQGAKSQKNAKGEEAAWQAGERWASRESGKMGWLGA